MGAVWCCLKRAHQGVSPSTEVPLSFYSASLRYPSLVARLAGWLGSGKSSLETKARPGRGPSVPHTIASLSPSLILWFSETARFLDEGFVSRACSWLRQDFVEYKEGRAGPNKVISWLSGSLLGQDAGGEDKIRERKVELSIHCTTTAPFENEK
ncbi:hypothetical protein PoB_006975100, partial [Plakobranchus ocellatus]